uniref:Uncharacterized protein n=1 Tax=Arundo donax TaxID=35708 RepID=A0A0A9F5R6_ARUDO
MNKQHLSSLLLEWCTSNSSFYNSGLSLVNVAEVGAAEVGAVDL